MAPRPLQTDPPATGWRLLLFDGARLERAGRLVLVPASGLRLLAFLALQGSVTRAKAACALWPESSEDHAQASLRTAMWRLRGHGDVVVAEHDRLRLAEDVWVDVRCLRNLAQRRVDTADPDATGDLAAVRDGRGELLTGWYDDWVLCERERFRQLRVHVLERTALLFAQDGEYGLALDIALDAVEVDPLRESGHCTVISVHLAEGNYVEALRHFQAFERLLLEELGVAPSSRMLRLLRPPGQVPAARRPDARGAVPQR